MYDGKRRTVAVYHRFEVFAEELGEEEEKVGSSSAPTDVASTALVALKRRHRSTSARPSGSIDIESQANAQEDAP